MSDAYFHPVTTVRCARHDQPSIATVTAQSNQTRTRHFGELTLCILTFQSWIYLDLATVHEQFAAGDEAGLLRCKKEHSVGDLGGISHAT